MGYFDVNTNLCDKCLHKNVCKYHNQDFANGRGVYIKVYDCPYCKIKDDHYQSELDKARKELNILENRLKHLLQSDFICRFDEKDYKTGEYVRDINDVDKLFYEK